MTLFGLSLIVLAWFMQLGSKKPTVLHSRFLFLYVVGAFILGVDGITSQLWGMAMLNLATAIIVLLVWKRQSGK